MTGCDAIDGALEAAVVPSFTRIGPAVRRRLYHWRPLESYDLTGRTVAITGPTSGLGRVAAEQLARRGADLILIARDAGKAENVRQSLLVECAGARIDIAIADMGSMDSVRDAAATIIANGRPLDTLIHNAGALSATRTMSEGIELTAAAQVAGPFLLTGLLLGLLTRSAGSRVITVSSGGMYTQPLDVASLSTGGDPYRGAVAYTRAKRAQVTLTRLWAQRTRGSGVRFHAMHPGWADTPGLAASLPGFRRIVGPLLRTPAEGADTIVWLAADDGPPLDHSGLFWLDRRPRAIHRIARTRRSDTRERRAALWAWCVEHTAWDG